YRLCPKLMGLEKTRRACFISQLGKCNGACEGREAPREYNERFAAAFERQRVADWPYPGAGLGRERHPGAPRSAGFIVENWCLTARLSEFEDGTVDATPEVQRFDLDRYRIIKQVLDNPRNRRLVTVMSHGQAAALAGAIPV